MDKPQNTIAQYVVTLLSSIYVNIGSTAAKKSVKVISEKELTH